MVNVPEGSPAPAFLIHLQEKDDWQETRARPQNWKRSNSTSFKVTCSFHAFKEVQQLSSMAERRCRNSSQTLCGRSAHQYINGPRIHFQEKALLSTLHREVLFLYTRISTGNIGNQVSTKVLGQSLSRSFLSQSRRLPPSKADPKMRRDSQSHAFTPGSSY
jgi:hypothetical protein